MDQTAVMDAALRQEFLLFLRFAFRELGGHGEYIHNWHIDVIAHQLSRIETDEIARLIVTMPPRHLKSIVITITWVAWMLGRNPALKFMCVAYGQELSEEYAAGCLKIMQSAWYRRAFPGTVLKQRAVAHFRTTAGGGRMSTSIDGVTTGFGADVIIIDDPMKAQDTTSEVSRTKLAAWYDTTIAQRLNSQETGKIILVMQRLHEADLAGILRQREDWHELRLPAIAEEDESIPAGNGRFYQRRKGCALHPAHLSLAKLRALQRANPYVFAAQFQQDPVPLHGNLIEREWLKTYDPATLDTSYGQIIQSWDTASKDNPFNDYSVCVTALMQGTTIYVLHVFRGRLKFPALKANAIELAREHKADVILVEDASSGRQLIDSLDAEAPRGVPFPVPRKPEGDKIARVMGISAMIETGRLALPKSAPWLAEFVSEVVSFPNGGHDDQVDALSQLMTWVRRADSIRPDTIAGPIGFNFYDDGSEEIIGDVDGIFNTDRCDDDSYGLDAWFS